MQHFTIGAVQSLIAAKANTGAVSCIVEIIGGSERVLVLLISALHDTLLACHHQHIQHRLLRRTAATVATLLIACAASQQLPGSIACPNVPVMAAGNSA